MGKLKGVTGAVPMVEGAAGISSQSRRGGGAGVWGAGNKTGEAPRRRWQ